MLKRKVTLSLGLCLLVSLFAGVAFSGFGGGGFGGGDFNFDPNAMQQRMEDNMRNQIGATEEQWKEMGTIVMKIQQLNQQLAIFSGRRMGGFGGGMPMGGMGGGFGGFGGPQGNAGNVAGSGMVMAAMGGGPGGGMGMGGPGGGMGMGGPGGGMGMGGFGGFGGGMMGGGEPTPLSKAVDALRATLQDTNAKPETIKAQLMTVRDERKKVEDEIKTEQDKLARIVASRPSQEAQLVLMGILK